MQNHIPDSMLLWRNAVPLEQAALSFAPTRLKEEWVDLQKQSAMEAAKDAVEQAQLAPAKERPTFLEILQPAQNILSARSKVLAECEQLLRGHLKSGALRSLAFEAPRTLASGALRLPARAWQNHHNLNSIQIKFESISYVEVRVIGAKHAANLLKSNLPKIHTNKAGRPSYKADIELAFITLLASGRFDLEGAIKPQASTIREWMIINTPNPKYGQDNPGYDIIRSTIKPLMDAERTRRADKL
ncbi:MAG: hypothetical protein GQ535_06170 [Rhodobacteraceae bacterium]|nr:hypothetical protein [Paracoccaceae bacterium]